MAEVDIPNKFGGFEALASGILNPIGVPVDDFEEVDPSKLLEEEEEDDDAGEDKEEDSDESDDSDDSSDDDSNDNSSDDNSTDDDDDIEGLGEYEAPLTKLLQEEIYKELEWDIEEGDELASVKDLVDHLKKSVVAASAPQYANEEVARLDEFVKNGGKLTEFYSNVPASGIDLDNIDLTDEKAQKDVVRELLSKVRGFKEDRIKRTLTRYEEGGILEEEAEEASELLKEYKSTSEERLLETQKNVAADMQKQQQKFYSDVEESVKALTDIRGITVSNKDKQELLDYIFKPGSDGRTKYQKDYASSVNHLIESAFFTKDKDKNTLVNKAKKSAQSDAYKEIHRKIKASKGKRQKSSGSQDRGGISDSLDQIGKSLIKKV